MHILDGRQNDQYRGADNEHFEKDRHAVQDEHVAEQRAGHMVHIKPGQTAECDDKACDAEIGQSLFGKARKGKIHDENHAKPAGQEDLRQ